MKLPNPYELERARFSGQHDIVSLDTSNVFKGQGALYRKQANQIADGVKMVGKMVGMGMDMASAAGAGSASNELEGAIQETKQNLGPQNHNYMGGSSNNTDPFFTQF